jgi:hypothetical protein
MIAALQKHSGIGAAETEKSNAQEEIKKREGWDSQRGSIQHSPMLDAMESLVKQYYARPEYFNNSVGSHSNRYLSPRHSFFYFLVRSYSKLGTASRTCTSTECS